MPTNYSKAYRYNLQQELSSDISSTSPCWVVAIIQTGKPITYSRAHVKGTGTVTDGAKSRNAAPVIVSDDCTSISISGSTKHPTKSLTLTLKSSGINYLSPDIIIPDDWIMVWLVSDVTQKTSLEQDILKGNPVNGPHSGLKFVGKIRNIRKQLSISGDGVPNSNYSIDGFGMNEFLSELYYDPSLITQQQADKTLWQTFMYNLGLDLFRLLEVSKSNQGVLENNTGELVAGLIQVILGKGPTPALTEGTLVEGKQSVPQAAPQATGEAPYIYLIPPMVAKLLGKGYFDSTKGEDQSQFGYCDILTAIIGIQKFVSAPPEGSSNPYAGFLPLIKEANGFVLKTDHALSGVFPPMPNEWMNVPLWSVMQKYLNRSINEMYTALKPTIDGSIVPTLVVRQIPFTTESFAIDQASFLVKDSSRASNPGSEAPKEYFFTRYMSLPRWVVPTSIIQGIDIGRSNVTRANLIHLVATSAAHTTDIQLAQQLTLSPPIFDSIDIYRNGIQSVFSTVDCSPSGKLENLNCRPWTQLVADWTLGSQYTLNGTIHTKGIQAPIAEGDNIEVEGVVYHIENLEHHAYIQPSGTKTWSTTMQVSNGMPSDQTQATADFPRYAGFNNTTHTTIVVDSEDVKDANGNILDVKVTGSHEVSDTTTAGTDTDFTAIDVGHTREM